MVRSSNGTRTNRSSSSRSRSESRAHRNQAPCPAWSWTEWVRCHRKINESTKSSSLAVSFNFPPKRSLASSWPIHPPDCDLFTICVKVANFNQWVEIMSCAQLPKLFRHLSSGVALSYFVLCIHVATGFCGQSALQRPSPKTIYNSYAKN